MLTTVLDLAQQNVIDDPEMLEEGDDQQSAIDDVTKAAEQLTELVGCDQATFEDRLANADADYIPALYAALAVLVGTEDD